MKKIIFSILTIAVFAITACSYDRSPNSGNYNPNDPGFEYAPEGDMYLSVPYDGYTQTVGNSNRYNPDSSNMRLPAVGTVARGKADYYFPYARTTEGYEKAGVELKDTMPNTPANLAEGKRLYETFCWHCHGLTGKSDGPVMASGKFPPPPFGTYQSDLIKNMPVGKMYYTITYGKNLMGAHGSLLSPKERWEIIHYVKHLAFSEAAPASAAPKAEAGAAKPDSTKSNK